MQLFVPYAAERPKTRLSSVLDADERRELSRAMLDDVLAALEPAAPVPPTVLATTPLESEFDVVVDDRSLDDAVNARLGDEPTAIVMADLPLVTPESLKPLFDSAADLSIAAGLGGGTNAFVARDPDFSVDYHGASYLDHLAIAEREGLSVDEVDSRLLAVDVDEPEDLTEVLLHGTGAARDWLVDAGFELETGGGRVTATRDGV